MPEFLLQSSFWISLLQIIAIDIMLGGDNAVVIALACRQLPEGLRNKGIMWGVVGAIGLRIVLIFFALKLLSLPFLKIAGAIMLLWIGIKLLHDEDEEHDIAGATHLLGAIKTIIVADAIMSLDNVIAVASVAKDDLLLVVMGILISIPIVIWGSKLVLKLMERFPVVITLGAALLGWIAGDMAVSDHWLQAHLAGAPAWLHFATAAAGALLVVTVGHFLTQRSMHRAEAGGQS